MCFKFTFYYTFLGQPQEEKKDTFSEKLITQIIKNLQVKISNIHIRYEDRFTNPQRPFAFGVTLQELLFQVLFRTLYFLLSEVFTYM